MLSLMFSDTFFYIPLEILFPKGGEVDFSLTYVVWSWFKVSSWGDYVSSSYCYFSFVFRSCSCHRVYYAIGRTGAGSWITPKQIA